jgi:hypothetical protein
VGEKTMNTKYLRVAILLTLIISIIATVGCVQLKKKSATATGDLKVNIDARNASNLGSLELTLTYDPAVVKAVSVEKGLLAPNASLEYSVDKPGKIWLGMIDAGGINGSGTLATISLDVTGSGDASSALGFEKVVANRSTNLMEIITQNTPGDIKIKSKAVTNPSITFSQ